MIFEGIEQLNVNEMFSWDYIDDAYMKYIKIKNKEFICFASDYEKPQVYIVCDKIKYEDLNQNWRKIK